MERIIRIIKGIMICLLSFVLVITGGFTVRAEETEDTSQNPETEDVTEETAEVDEDAAESAEEPLIIDEAGERHELPEIGFETESTIPATNIFPASQGTDFGLQPGESIQLEYELEPADSDEEPEWYVSWDGNNCISLSADGMVTANSITGHASVYAQISSGSVLYYNIYVSYQTPSSITYDRDSYKIAVNNGRTINWNVEPWLSNYCRKHVTSSDPSVVQIGDVWVYQNSSWITGLKAGIATVTVTADNGVSTSVVVEVLDGTFADSISSEETEVGLKVGDAPYQLKYQLSPADSTEKPEFRLNYANNDCITVDSNGLVTPLGSGNASVIAEIMNGSQVYYNIYVRESDPASIAFEKFSYLIGKDGSAWVNLNIQPNGSYYSRKHVVSSDPSVVRVVNEWIYDSGFSLYGESEGTATITVTTDNGLTAQTEVTVKEGLANNIWTGNSSTYHLHRGEGTQLQYTLSPDTATEKPVWTIERDSAGCIAAVDNNGYVIASSDKTGSADIKATISNGQYAYYSVYVADDPVSMSFDQNEYTTVVGNALNLANHLKMFPLTAQYARISAVSDNPGVCKVTDWNSGRIRATGVSAGTATITVTAENGVSTSTTVNVMDGYASRIRAQNSTIYLEPEESESLVYTLETQTGDLSKENVTFEITSGEDVITLNGDRVTAVKPGKATVSAKTAFYYNNELNDGNNFLYSCSYTIYVSRQPGELHFASDVYTLKKNEEIYIRACSSDPASDYNQMQYASDNTGVVTVSNYENVGRLTAISPGTTTITATAENGVTASATVIVTDETIQYKSVAFNVGNYNVLQVGEQLNLADHAFTDYSYQTHADLSDFTIISGNPDIASVNNGVVTAVSPGSARIVVFDPYGNRAGNIGVQVYSHIDSMQFMQSEYTIKTDDSLDLWSLLEFSPKKYLFKGINFKSSDESVVKVSEDGTAVYASGVSEGNAVITASAEGKTASFTVHVDDDLSFTDITLYEDTPIILHKNYRKQLKINNPTNDSKSEILLTSSDPTIVSIKSYDEFAIFGEKCGNATVTATLRSDPSKSVTIPVTVVDGDVDNYLFSTYLLKMNDSQDNAEFIGSGEEFTCYVGNAYNITSSAEWIHSYGLESPQIGISSSTERYESDNNCIIDIPVGRGAASGPSAYSYTASGMYFLALRPGTARVRTIGNHYATIHVVEETGAKLIINAPKTSIAIDETVQLTAEIESEEPVTETVQWYSSDDATVSVDQNGNIKGLREGKATIIAKAGNVTDSVEITVYGPLTVNLLTEEEIKANTPTTLKAEVSGGLEPYTYKFTVKVNGEWITIANPDNQSEVSYTFAEPGTYSVCAAVTDATRTTSKSQKKITVKSDEPLKVDLIAEENIKANTPTVFKAEVSGGLEPYTYKFTVKINGVWETIQNPDNSSEVSYTFAEPGTYTICATVKDTAGTTLKSQKKITVKNDEPLAVNLVSEESITPGIETILKAEVNGGAEPYTYRFTVKINGVWETIENPDNSSEVSYIFPESGIYPVNVTVKDSTGETVKQLLKLYVAEELNVELAKVSGAKVGEAVTLEGYAEGGIAPYQYKFAVKENGKWVTKRSYSSESTYEWTPKESGNIPVCVYVKDAGGMITKHQTKIYVSDSE